MRRPRSVVTIPARLVGSLVPPAPWQGTVLAVFPQAVNLAVESLCISLVADPRAMSSLSLNVPALFQDARRPLREALGLATDVRMATGSIRLRVDVGTTLAITLSQARLWHGALHPSDVVGFQLHGSEALAQGLRRYGRAGGMLGLCAGASATSPLLRSTIAAFQRACPMPPLSHLIGLGIGLTPSGDDFLTGVLLADRMCALAGLVEPRLQVDRRAIATALERTNTPGRTLLWQALQGRFPAYLLTFARAFCAFASAADSFETCLVQTLEHGHTSGTDAVVGFWWCLEQVQGA